MVSNIAGVLSLRTFVMPPSEVPQRMHFDESKASKGAIVSRQAVADAYGVHVSNVHFTMHELMSNTDDMAKMFSRFRGDGSGEGLNSVREAVIVKDSAVQKHSPSKSHQTN